MWATFWRSRADVEGYENSREDPSGAWGRVSKRRHLLRFLIRNTRTHLFMSTDAFESQQKMSCRRPHPVSLPNNHPSRWNKSFRRPHPPLLMTATPTFAMPPQLRRCQYSNARPPTLLAFLSLQVWVVPRMAAVATSEQSTSQERTPPYATLWYPGISEDT